MSEIDTVAIERATKLGAAFRGRAVNLRRYAAWILAIIVVVLSSGIAVFVAAGTLANRETATAVDESRRALLDSLLKQRTAAEIELKKVTEERDITEERLREEVVGRGGTGRMGEGPVARLIQRQLIELEDRTSYLRTQIADIAQRMPQLLVPAAKSVPPEAQITSLVSAISTRVGAIVLLLFLVQILVPLYRYNAKLASHYDACADGLELLLVSGSAVPLDLYVRLTTVLSPSGVEFGAAPTAPTEQALRVVADILGRK